MTHSGAQGPFFVLIDDQMHSARLMWRTLHRIDPKITLRWLGDARRGARLLANMFDGHIAQVADLIIVDLKAHSGATAEFVTAIRTNTGILDIPVAAMSNSLAAEQRDVLIAAGADGVFERNGDLDAYTTEIEQLAAFWRHARAPRKIRA